MDNVRPKSKSTEVYKIHAVNHKEKDSVEMCPTSKVYHRVSLCRAEEDDLKQSLAVKMEIKSEILSGVCDYSRLYLEQRHQTTAATLNKQKLKFGMEEILGTIGEDKVNKHTNNNPITTTVVSPSPSVRNIFISTIQHNF